MPVGLVSSRGEAHVGGLSRSQLEKKATGGAGGERDAVSNLGGLLSYTMHIVDIYFIDTGNLVSNI